MILWPVLALCSCMEKQNGEIADMVETCFQHRQGIVITFMPTPELSHDGKEEKIK